MNAIEQTEQVVHDHNIVIIQRYLAGLKIISVLSKNCKLIIVDRSNIETIRELNTLYLHEFEHLESPHSMYNFYTSPHAVRVREGNLKRKLIKKLIPKDYLIEKFKYGYELYEIAEELCLSEDLIRAAIELYNER